MTIMRKAICIAVLTALLCACSGHRAVDRNVAHRSSQLDTTALTRRVALIYDRAFSHYAAIDSLLTAGASIAALPSLDSLFCSADWNDWLGRVKHLDDSLAAADGAVGFFEADYWIMGQDWQNLAVSAISVKAMNDKAATVECNLHNCGKVTVVRLEMTREDGEWRIDDFVDVDNDLDWKACMKEYVGQHNVK